MSAVATPAREGKSPASDLKPISEKRLPGGELMQEFRAVCRMCHGGCGTIVETSSNCRPWRRITNAC